jgi:excisionase family DNA binding protein
MSEKRNGFRIPDQLLLPWSPRYTISVAHAAKMLDCSMDTVCRMIEDGTLQAYKMRPNKPNSPWRVNYDSVISHVEKLHEKNGLEKRF